MTDELANELTDKKNDTGYSGIDIEEAKQMLKNEDQYDKQLYRDRIKRMHREKRLKEKDLRRAKRAKSNGEAPTAILDDVEDDKNNNDYENNDDDGDDDDEESDYEEKHS